MNNRFTSPAGFKLPLRVRRGAKHYSSGRSRAAHALSIPDRLLGVQWMQFIRMRIAHFQTLAPGFRKRREARAINAMFRLLKKLICERDVPTHCLPRNGIFVGMLPESTMTHYRFRTKDDIIKLMTALQIPLTCHLPNRETMPGETVFLFFLRRLSCLNTIEDLVNSTFGGSESSWTRAFNWMAKWLADRWQHKLTNNWAYWLPMFPTFAEKIRQYVNERMAHPPPGYTPQLNGYVQGLFYVVAFIDCNVTRTCVPGGGPTANGFRHQSIDLPNGMTMHLWGPASIRQPDTWCLTRSNVLPDFGAAQNGQATQFVIYGDAIYPNGPHIRRRTNFNRPHVNATIDWAFSSGRECIEHHYGEEGQLFPYFRKKEGLKICNQGQPIKELYLVRTLLRNCYVCLYHNKTSLKFNCPPPDLFHYMQ